MTSTVKTIIGVALLVVGAWVVWSGFQQDETLTIILGVASLIGGAVFLLPRGRARTTTPHL